MNKLDKLKYDILDIMNEKFEDYAFGRNKEDFIFVNGALTEKVLEFDGEEELIGDDREKFIKEYIEDLLSFFYKKKFMKKEKPIKE